jgi:hypothetical protein
VRTGPTRKEGRKHRDLFVVLVIEAVNTSETSANSFQIARFDIPEDGYLRVLRREILKSRSSNIIFLKI